MRTIATMSTASKLQTSISLHKVVFLLAIFVYSATGKVAQHFEDNQSNTFQFDHETCLSLRSNRPRIECSTVQPAVNFTLQIGSSHFTPHENIPVNVFMTNCPSTKDSGTKWYTIEILGKKDSVGSGMEAEDIQESESIGSGMKANSGEELKEEKGKLKYLFKHRDVHKCSDNDRFLFYPCEPSPFNFPGKYQWKAPSKQPGSVCFKLTALQQDSTHCETVEKCVDPVQGSYSNNNKYDEPIDYYDEYGNSGEDTLTSGKRYGESLSDDEELDKTYFDENEPAPKCKEERSSNQEFGIPWLPDCDCEGYYNPVQCYNVKNKNGDLRKVYCWCSTLLGDEMIDTRTEMDCSKTDFELSCQIKPL